MSGSSSFDRIKTNIGNYAKEKASNKKNVVTAVIFVVMLVVYIVLSGISSHIISGLTDQVGAGRWSKDIRVGQVSLFIAQKEIVSSDDLKRFTYMLEDALRLAGVGDEEDDEASSPIVDTVGIDEMNSEESDATEDEGGISDLMAVACSAQGTVSLVFEDRVVDSANAIGVEGDFFTFHPMKMVSGSWFDPEGLMKDSIVIDQDLAWQLFGSSNVAGQCVTIGGVPHYISGVTAKEKGRIAKASGLSGGFVYMSLDSLSKYGNIISGRTESREVSEDGTTAMIGGINCIEVLCPNPVNGLAAKLSKQSLGLDDQSVIVVDNTERYSTPALFKVLRSFGTRSMWGKAVFYPYWENIARGYEDILAILLFFRLIALLIVIVILVVAIVNLYRHKKWTVRDVADYLSDKKYDLEVKHNQKKQLRIQAKAGDEDAGGEE